MSGSGGGRWIGAVLALLGGCAEEPTGGVDPCAGREAADVDLGQGNEQFAPWFDGDVIPLEKSGGYGFWLTLRTSGLDTRERMTTSVAFAVGQAPSVSEIEVPVTYACLEDGTGNATVFVTLPDELQSEDAVSALDGEVLDVVATVTDVAGDLATSELELVVGSAWLTASQ